MNDDLIDKIKKLFYKGHGSRYMEKELKISRGKIRRIYKVLGIDNIKRYPLRKPIPKNKLCRTCKQDKLISEFRKREKNNRISYESYCKICENNRNNNRLKKMISERLKYDTNFRLRRKMSYSIYKYLTLNETSKKNQSFSRYLNYSMDDLKYHLESQFEWWMNWNNWSVYKKSDWKDDDPNTWKWQIDHVIPASEFKYGSMEDDEFIKCWSLENLRPLNAKVNVLDGTKRLRHRGKY